MDSYKKINSLLIGQWDKASLAAIQQLHTTDPSGAMRLIDRNLLNAVEAGRADAASFLVGQMENFMSPYAQDALKLAAARASSIGGEEWKQLFLLARTPEGHNKHGVERSLGNMANAYSRDSVLTIVQGLGEKFNVGDVLYGLEAAARNGWTDVIDEAFRNPAVKKKLGTEEELLRKTATQTAGQPSGGQQHAAHLFDDLPTFTGS